MHIDDCGRPEPAAVTIETDREGRVSAWDLGAEQVFGWSAHDMICASADCLFTPEDLARRRAAIEMKCALETGRADDERWHLTKSGAPFWGHSEMLPLLDAEDAHCGFVKRVRNLTRERETAAAQHADLEFLRSVLAASGDCIKVLDLDAKLTFMTEQGQRLMEVSDFNAIRGCAWLDFWHGAGNNKAEAAVAAAKAGGLGHFVALGSTMAGTPKWWDVQVTPFLGADGRPQPLLSVSRDITDARRADAAAHDARSLNTLILNSSRDCIVVLDLDGRTRFVSPGGIESMEISDLAAVIGQSWLRVWAGADLAAAEAELAVASAGGTSRFEGFCAAHEGTPKWWDVVVSSLPAAADRPQQLVAIGRDISEARRAGQLLGVAEERLAVALRASGVVGLWDWDLDAGLIRADANFARIYARDATRAAEGETFADHRSRLHPDDLAMIEQQLARTFAERSEFSSEHRIVHLTHRSAGYPRAVIQWIDASG